MVKENRIIIDVGSKKKTINPMIYSAFIEHLGECIHNGLWTYDPVNVPLVKGNQFLEGVREDVLEAAKDLSVSVLRAFGGCYSDVYHWKDAIGPRNSRKKIKNRQWSRFPMNFVRSLGPKIENQFGTNEFLHFCEAIGAEAYLNINYSTGTLEEAANWVEYCNSSIDTEYGALRAKNGRKKPYNVKYWGIANEIWGPQEVGREKHPENYAKKYLTFAKVMREKDPSIKLIAVGWFKSYWNQTVLKLIGEEWVDYLSMHKYVPLPFGLTTLIRQKHPHKEKTYYSLMSAHRTIEGEIRDAWEDITTALGKDTHVRITFDEWGIWYILKDLIHTNFNLQDGLATALNLMIFQRMSDKSPMANWAQLVNVVGTIQTDPDGIIITPPYLALKMIQDHSYNNLIDDVDVNCDIFESRKYGQIKKYKDTPYVMCNATVNNKKNALSLIIVNKHFSDDLKIILEIKGFNPKEKGTKIELNSESPFDYNITENRNRIQLKESELDNVSLNMTIELPAHSITVLKLSQ